VPRLYDPFCIVVSNFFLYLDRLKQGESGNDTFVVRSFIALVIDTDGNVLGSDSAQVELGGGDGTDEFKISANTTTNETETAPELFDAKEEDPDYVVVRVSCNGTQTILQIESAGFISPFP